MTTSAAYNASEQVINAINSTAIQLSAHPSVWQQQAQPMTFGSGFIGGLVLATSHIAFATTDTGDGWHDGYTDGRADCLANQPQVDPGNDDRYNAMYKPGYGAGYLAASAL